jgi:hypothetical protein
MTYPVPAGKGRGKFQMAKVKVPYTRRRNFSGKKSYKSYLEWLKNCCNAVNGTFYDAISLDAE